MIHSYRSLIGTNANEWQGQLGEQAEAVRALRDALAVAEEEAQVGGGMYVCMYVCR